MMALSKTRRALMLGGMGACLPRALSASQSAGETQRRQLRCTITFRNPRAEPAGQAVFWMYAPMASAGRQALGDTAVSMPFQLVSDDEGHRILRLDLTAMPPLASKTVTFAFEVVLASGEPQEALLHPEQWLASEKYIETNAPEVATVAASLRRKDSWETATAIYDWTSQNIRYAGFVADDMGALHALRARRGDCTEYAYLAVALARANGIPGRMVGGFVADRNLSLRQDEYHNWAELYVDGAWRVLDAQRGVWRSSESIDYVSFRHHAAAMRNPIGSAHRYRMEGSLDLEYAS